MKTGARRPAIIYILGTGMIAGTLVFAEWNAHRPPDVLQRPLAGIPETLRDWRVYRTESLSDRVQGVLKPTSYISRSYTNGRFTLDLFVAYFALQRTGETMHSPRHCLPSAGWQIWKSGTAEIPIDGQAVTVNKISIRNASAEASAMYWYQSSGHIVADEYRARAFQVLDSITRGRRGGSIVRIVSVDQPEASKAAEEFAALVMPVMQRCLGR